MTFAADGAATDSTAHKLQRAQAAIEHDLEQLAHTAATLRSQWSGEARHAFDTAHTQWQKETAIMATILDQAIGALQAANTAAGNADRAATALWQ